MNHVFNRNQKLLKSRSIFVDQLAHLFVIIILILMIAPLSAQQDAGVLRVLAEDPTGAVVVGAAVKVTNNNTNVSLAQTTGGGGYATFSPIQPGTYTVEVSMPGFAVLRINNVVIDVNQNLMHRAQLAIAGVTEAIEVTATPAAIQTEDASLGQVVKRQVITELPLAGRRYTDLQLLVPGVTESNANPDIRGAGWLVTHGTFPSMNNYLLDGLDNNQNTHNWQSRSAQVVAPSPDALAEFKVQTNNFSAEFGRAAGAVINAAIRSGTNEVHGSAWWYNRNDALAANSWRNNSLGLPKAPLKWNQMGGTFGGPLKKSKLFLFGHYEAYLLTNAETQTATIPTAAMHEGNFSSLTTSILDPTTNKPFEGNIIPKTRWDSLGKKVLDVYPMPNLSGIQGSGGRVTQNYGRSLPIDETTHKSDIRIDHYATDKNRFFGRYSFNRNSRYIPALLPGLADTGIGQGGLQFARNQAIAASWNHFLTSTKANELRFGYNLTQATFVHTTVGMTTGTEFGFKGIPPFLDQVGGIPRITPTGYSAMGVGRFRPQYHNPYSVQVTDSLSIVAGAHTIKMGFDFRLKQDTWVDILYRVIGYEFNSRFTNDAAADILLGLPSAVGGSNFMEAKEMQANYSGYFQDDWKVRPNLTFNLGLRYEYVTPYWGRKPYQNTNIDYASGKLVIPEGSDLVFGALQAKNKYAQNPDFNNLGPRIGVAYQMGNWVVLRGAYGVYFAGEDASGTNADLIYNVPNLWVVTLQRVGTGPPPLKLSDPIPSNFLDVSKVTSDNLSYKSRSPDFPAQTVQQWNVALQFLLSNSSSLELAYVGNHGRNLLDLFNPNYAPWGRDGSIPANRPYPQLGIIELGTTTGTSHYNGLEAKYEKRFTGSWYNLTSYTYACGLGTTGSFIGGGRGFQTIDTSGPVPQPDYRNEQRFNPEMTRQRLSVANIYKLPLGHGQRFGANMNRAANLMFGGWQASLILTVKSGQPVNVTISSTGDNPLTGKRYTFLPQSGGGQIRPNRVGKPNTGIDPHVDRFHFLDVKAFDLQPLNTPGNSAPYPAWGPGFWNADLSIMKRFVIQEGKSVDFRFEMFNMFNNTNFAAPSGSWSGNSFGVITDAFSPRQIQMALRFAF